MTGRKKYIKSTLKKKSAVVKTTGKTTKAEPVKKAAAVKKVEKKTTAEPRKKALKPTAAKTSKIQAKAKAKPKTKAYVKAAKKKSVEDKARVKWTEETIKMLSRSKKQTPAVFKLPSKKQTPIVFSLEDVREVLKKNQEDKNLEKKSITLADVAPAKVKISAKRPPARKKAVKLGPKAEKHRVLGAASVADILGFNPKQKQLSRDNDTKNIPKKHLKYFRKLVELREHVLSGLTLHSKETLKRSTREDSGNLSNYSQHAADVGTENFERDFALNLLSSEQEALHEIEQAIQRIYNGTYGVCQITRKAISKDRLSAVPFTRFSIEGQAQKENESGRIAPHRGAFMDSTEAAADFKTEDAEN